MGYGIIYAWVRKQQPKHTVEQLLLPKQYHQIVCKLAHTIPIAGYLGRDKTLSKFADFIGRLCRVLLEMPQVPENC